MLTLAQATKADPLYAQPAAERPAYATGMMLDAKDFTDEQTYHRVQLARAMAALAGGGTLAGLRASHSHELDMPEEIRIDAGLGVDRIGRLVEIPRPACLRLARWFQAQAAGDGDTLKLAVYDDPGRFLSPRALSEAGAVDAPVAVPTRAVVADVFIRFVACARGLSPSFAQGPFDALNAVATSRLRDAYELQLIAREGLDDAYFGLPMPPGADALGDTAASAEERRDALQNAVFAAWPAKGRSSAGTLSPLPEHPADIDPSAIFIARVLIPVDSSSVPARVGEAVLVDNYSRRFLPSAALVGQWMGV